MSYVAVLCAVTHNFHWNRFPVFSLHSFSHTPVASVLELLKNAFSVSYGIRCRVLYHTVHGIPHAKV